MQRSNSAEEEDEEANSLKLCGLWKNLARWADLQHCRILQQLNRPKKLIRQARFVPPPQDTTGISLHHGRF